MLNSFPKLVTAVAGAGKTRYLVELARSLSKPTLLVTFTRAATSELRQRVGRAPHVTISTAHALAWRLLHEPTIEEAKYHWIIERVRRDQRIDMGIPELIDIVRKIKSRLVQDPGPWGRFYAKVEAERLRSGIVTFDDVLLQAALLNRRERRIQFDYVLQDEAQDQNEVQEAFITSCVKDSGYCAVGDAFQCIFEFRGSDPTLISESRFKERWPGASVETLHVNYRSRAEIVAAADAISAPRATAHRGPGGVFATTTYSDVVEEANAVAGMITDQDPNSVAVLYRRRDQAGVLELALRRRKVPFQTKTPYLEQVKPLLSYLWLAVGRGVESDVKRSLNHPFRFLSRIDLDTIASRLTTTVPTFLELVAHQKTPAYEWAGILDRLALLAENAAAPVVVDALLKALPTVKDRGLLECARLELDLHAMLEGLSAPVAGSGVTLATVHEAKGREWDHVYYVGMEPGSGEEGRINYVAYTRARESLVVSSIHNLDLLSDRQTSF